MLLRVVSVVGSMVVVIVAGVQFSVVSAATGAVIGRPLHVAFESGRLTVRAEGVRLADVLQAIGREAHLKVLLRGSVEAIVSDDFADVSLEEGIRRLTRSQSVVMIYDSVDVREPATVKMWSLTEVWLVNRSLTKESSETTAGETRRSADLVPAGPGGVTEALNAVNRETRRESLNALTRDQNEYTVVGSLREAATTDASSLVRYRAIQTLESMNSPYALDALRGIVNSLRENALANPDVRARREAVQSLAGINSVEASDALREALNDRHPGVAAEARKALTRQKRQGLR